MSTLWVDKTKQTDEEPEKPITREEVLAYYQQITDSEIFTHRNLSHQKTETEITRWRKYIEYMEAHLK